MGEPLGYASSLEITRDLLADLPAYAALAGGTIPAEGALGREHPPSGAPGDEDGANGAQVVAPGDEDGANGAQVVAPGDAPGAPDVGSDGGLVMLTYSE